MLNFSSTAVSYLIYTETTPLSTRHVGGIQQDNKKLQHVTYLEQRTLAQVSISPVDMIPLYYSVEENPSSKYLHVSLRFVYFGHSFFYECYIII